MSLRSESRKAEKMPDPGTELRYTWHLPFAPGFIAIEPDKKAVAGYNSFLCVMT